MNDEIRSIVTKKLDEVMAQKEEILTAFMAKYGCQPDEIEQIQEFTPQGSRWYVRLKN